MSTFIYVKFILSVAYIVGFYRQIQFYYMQADYFKINLLIFVENCIYAMMSFVLLWTLFEKKEIYQRMLRVMGIYSFVSLSLFAIYVFKNTLSPIEYWAALATQFLNILIIGRMYIFKPKECQKKLKKRNVSLNAQNFDLKSPFEFYDEDTSQNIKFAKSHTIAPQEGLRSHMRRAMAEQRLGRPFERDVKKVRNFVPSKKTQFKRLKKFDLKKV